MKRPLLFSIVLVLTLAGGISAPAQAGTALLAAQSPATTFIYMPVALSPAAEWTFHKTADGQHPDGNEQQLMWLMNRARADPTAEGIWLATTSEPDIAFPRSYFNVDLALLQSEFASYTPKAPAAFDVRLYEAARLHSEDLIARDAQDHTGQLDRVFATGITLTAWRGNVFSYADSALNAHGGFNIDWGADADGMQDSRGHRKAVMALDGDYSNVGFAMIPENDVHTKVGPFVTTENFAVLRTGVPNQYNVFIVGTVWADANANGRYDPGEGFGGVTVSLDSGPYFAITANGGGYAIPVLAAGEYLVRFSGTASGEVPVTVGAVSVLVDLKVNP